MQTIGAVAAAINRGQLSLQSVIDSGTIDNLDRYGQIINYVQGGHFQMDLNLYDTIYKVSRARQPKAGPVRTACRAPGRPRYHPIDRHQVRARLH